MGYIKSFEVWYIKQFGCGTAVKPLEEMGDLLTD